METAHRVTATIQVFGTSWWPNIPIRKIYPLLEDDVRTIRLIEKNWFETTIEEVTERAIERWVKQHCGEFWRVHDFEYQIIDSTIYSKLPKPLTNPSEYAII